MPPTSNSWRVLLKPPRHTSCCTPVELRAGGAPHEGRHRADGQQQARQRSRPRHLPDHASSHQSPVGSAQHKRHTAATSRGRTACICCLRSTSLAF